MTEHGLWRHVEDLLRGRRPRPFRFGGRRFGGSGDGGVRSREDDAAVLRAAITLRAARPGDDAPRPEFVADLQRRLAAQLADPGAAGRVPADPERRGTARREPPEPPVPLLPPTGARGLGRRALVAGGAGLAAAAAAAGVLVDRVVLGAGRGATTGPPEPLTPVRGTWRTVVASADLPEGAVRAFDAGAVVGFVRRADGVPRAVSGVCTHQGCRLLLDGASRRLDCPCHTTVFALDGEVLAHQLPIAPGPLPELTVREVDGAVQVLAPPI